MGKIGNFFVTILLFVVEIHERLCQSKKKIFGFNAGKLLIVLIKLLCIIFIPYFVGKLAIYINAKIVIEGTYSILLFISYWTIGIITSAISILILLLILGIIKLYCQFFRDMYKGFKKWFKSSLKWLRN